MEAKDLLKSFHLKTPFTFHFYVLGIGGTGSNLVPPLVRLLKVVNSGRGLSHGITLVDGDVVEESNIGRQNFFAGDIGKNKAVIMASKCSSAFGMEVGALDKFIENRNDLSSLLSSSSTIRIPFFVGCGDVHPLRKLLHTYIEDYTSGPLFYLDSGNEEYAGQVVLGCRIMNTNVYNKATAKSRVRSGKGVDVLGNISYTFNLPTVVDLYPEIKTSVEKFKGEMSCAELAVSNPQSPAVNLEAATQMYKIISNCISVGSISYHHVVFNTLWGNSSTTFNTYDSLSKLNSEMYLTEMAEDYLNSKYRTEPEANTTTTVVEGSHTLVTGFLPEETPESLDFTVTLSSDITEGEVRYEIHPDAEVAYNTEAIETHLSEDLVDLRREE